MNELYLIIFVIVTVISVISIVSYVKSCKEQKNIHKEIISQLSPSRDLELNEKNAFEKLYKKKLTSYTPVYNIEGPIEYIGLTVNGNDNLQFSIGGLRIANRCAVKLKKKKIGIDLEEEAEIDDLIEPEDLDEAFKELKAKGYTDEEAQEILVRNVQELEEEVNCVADIVFLPKDMKKSQAYIVKFNEWSITGVLS